MKMPWADQTGLTRTAAIVASILGIASGLCGLNAEIQTWHLSPNAMLFVMFAGLLEFLAMILSGIALLIIGFTAVIRALIHLSQGHR